MENVIATIDIWSSKIKTVVWHFDPESDNFNILWVSTMDSNAIRKWTILDMEEFKKNLEDSLVEAEKMSWEQMAWAYISFNSSSIEVINNNWVVAVWWEEIDFEDVNRSLDMAKNWIDLPNRQILKVIPDVFTVDLEDSIRSPIWMLWRKLEVKTNIFFISNNVLNNIKRWIWDIWLEIYDVYPNLISAPEAVLTKKQKELWVVCIDIWASTTWVTIYEEGSLKHSAIIPIWWESVTNDIAIWCRVSIDVAEKLKIKYWEANLDKQEHFMDREIDLSEISTTEEWSVSLKFLSQIIDARYLEIIHFVKEELRKIWKEGQLPEWAVLVWWWAKMRSITTLMKDNLRLPIMIGLPFEKKWAQTSISDPLYAWVIWTLILARRYPASREWFSFPVNFWWIGQSIMKVIKKILP